MAGSYLVKAAIGENVDNEFLGGADTHSGISGVTDYKSKDDKAALDKIRSIVDKIGSYPKAGFKRSETRIPEIEKDKIYSILPKKITQPYDSYELIDSLIDHNSIDEYKKEYGQTIITCYAKIDGWSIGIVANQRSMVKSKNGEMQFGGVIYGDAADKATRFIANCNQKIYRLFFYRTLLDLWLEVKQSILELLKMVPKWLMQLLIQLSQSLL